LSGWLLDTNVLSAVGPGKRPLPPNTAAWFHARADSLYFSTITAAEIEAGIAKLRRMGSIRRADNLHQWFNRVINAYGERVLSFDVAAARIAGTLGDAAHAAGRHPGFSDVAIAAVAQVRELVVLTTNTRHFEPLGVAVLNPFAVSD
jgi:predicted nucleic acid-binding protein